MVRWDRGDRIEYAANDDYFLGKPKLRKIELRIIPDENTDVNQLRAHEIDWVVLGTPRMYPQLKSIAGVDVHLVPFNGNDAIMFNTERPPFDDARVRRAIGLAIDKPRLSREVTFGTTVPATEDLPPLLWAFDPHAGTSQRDLPGAQGAARRGRLARRPRRHPRQGRPQLTMGLAFRSDSITDRNRGVQIAAMLHDAGDRGRAQGLHHRRCSTGRPAPACWPAGGSTPACRPGTPAPIPTTRPSCSAARSRPHGFNWAGVLQPRDGRRAERRADPLRPPDPQARLRADRAAARARRALRLPVVAAPDRGGQHQLKNFRPNGMVEDWNAWEWSL